MLGVRKAAEIAIEEADAIIFVVNGREGMTDNDKFVARMLQRSKKPVVLAVNKIDDQAFIHNIYELYIYCSSLMITLIRSWKSSYAYQSITHQKRNCGSLDVI